MSDLSNLQTRVTVVWATESTSTELRDQFHAGKVVRLSQPTTQAIEFFADGRLRGRGEMVHVDGRLGVRVTELTSDSAEFDFIDS